MIGCGIGLVERLSMGAADSLGAAEVGLGWFGVSSLEFRGVSVPIVNLVRRKNWRAVGIGGAI